MPEPRLKHVSMWKNNKWVPITIEETKRLFPNVTVSAKSGMFMCRLCNQKVALTSNTRRYFKHSRAEDDKNCEDRSEAYYNGYYGSIGSFFDYIPQEYLPLKIKVMKSNFSIEMGFGKLKIFDEVQSFSVKSEGNNVFNYSSERIQKSEITYLGVGINPAETYTLTVIGDNKKSTYEIVSVEKEMQNIIKKVEDILTDCTCDSACYRCIKHYRNQFVHGMLDRFAALDLLRWGVSNSVPEKIDNETQIKYLSQLNNILELSGCTISASSKEIVAKYKNVSKKLKVYPGMLRKNSDSDDIWVSDYMLKYAAPYVVNQILKEMNII